MLGIYGAYGGAIPPSLSGMGGTGRHRLQGLFDTLTTTSTQQAEVGGTALSISMSDSSLALNELVVTSTTLATTTTTTTITETQVVSQFVEDHRKLLNSLIAQNPNLLYTSLSLIMVKYPRMIDFENKRGWFRAQIRREQERQYGTCRINVRRAHIFQDSFFNLNSRQPEDLKGKVTIVSLGGHTIMNISISLPCI